MARTEKTYNKKKELIAVRIDKELLDLMVLYANAGGQNMSEFIRMAINNEINSRIK